MDGHRRAVARKAHISSLCGTESIEGYREASENITAQAIDCPVMEDDLVCEYDSTWDTESDGDDLGENVTRRSSQDKTQKSWGFVCFVELSKLTT
ncbi:hypothetical protein JZ751_014662 [Albula glossodonta]|uniref:Uncharacterized protein n=1 Tax=Albula glossodonta TaxID=121402 RepID=A0A8T2MX87_9TELE|nr:hypothetical protein JZ751_014662 [Albula glossodonta]